MKKLFTPLFLLATCGMQVSAQTNNTDTLVVEKPELVTIISTDSTYNVQIQGASGQSDYLYTQEIALNGRQTTIIKEYAQGFEFSLPFKKKKHCDRNSIITGGLGFGFVNALNAPAGMNVKMGASYEIMWMHIVAYQWRPSCHASASFSIGVGINWKNYRMTGKNQFIQTYGDMTVGAYPENANSDFSRLKVFSWSVPLQYQQNLPAKMRLVLGPVINFNTYASLLTEYQLEERKQRYFSKHIHQNPVTVDLMGSLHFNNIGFYVKYAPTHVLDTEFGPSFNSFSTGVILCY